MTIKISNKGQIVIPASIRAKYGLKPKSKVELIDLGNEIVIVPIPGKSCKDARGILKGISVKDLITQRRSERRVENLKYD
ncbi:MAG: AbrB/MazE/SpoVT family DNA-binding domain-containing protein [Armatimonadota bacterium]